VALYNNGYRLGSTPFRSGLGALTTIYNGGGSLFRNAAPTGRMRASAMTFGEYAARPQGALHPGSWMLPQKAGALSSHNEAQGASTAALNLAAGRNIAGQADGATPTAQATLQLVVSMTGTADGIATVTGNVLAALGMSGSAAGSSTADAAKNAIAWCYGEGAGSSAATLTRYATGRLYGSITPYTELSPQTLAAAVIAAAEADPITANVARVNGYTVGGNGQSGTEWGPA
jgi:hypothetical protein